MGELESGADSMNGLTSASLPIPFPSDAQTMSGCTKGMTDADVADFEELQRHLLGLGVKY